jgi:hypothetical protein
MVTAGAGVAARPLVNCRSCIGTRSTRISVAVA